MLKLCVVIVDCQKIYFFKECIAKGHPCTFRMLLITNEPFQTENDFTYMHLQQLHMVTELEKNFTSIIVCCWTGALLSAIQHQLIAYFGGEDVCASWDIGLWTLLLTWVWKNIQYSSMFSLMGEFSCTSILVWQFKCVKSH